VVIEGFDLSISTDDVVVSNGFIGDVAVAGATLDVSALALGDGTHAIIYDGSSVTAQLDATALTSGEYKLGEFTEDTAAATAVSRSGRGKTLAVTIDGVLPS